MRNKVLDLCNQVLSSFPECSEKSCILITLYFNYMKDCDDNDAVSAASEFPLDENDIRKVLNESFYDQLEKEGLTITRAYRRYIDDIKKSLESTPKDYLSSAIKSSNLLKELRPLDVDNLNQRLNGNKEMGEKIEGQDCVFVFGLTGAGKTHLIHQLLASKFKR